MVDYVGKWTVRAELPAKQLLGWIGLPTSKYHLWRQHYGRPHAHNAHIPRDGWLEAWEKQAIIDYHRRFPLEGYRRLAYMMLDQDVVAVSPTSVYRVLKAAGLLDRNRWAPSKKGKGFVQPIGPHEHWHIDISYLNIAGNFVTHYNEVRLHSALGYVTPHDKLAGRDTEIFDSRDSKLEAARAKRLGAKSRAAEQSLTHTVLM